MADTTPADDTPLDWIARIPVPRDEPEPRPMVCDGQMSLDDLTPFDEQQETRR